MNNTNTDINLDDDLYDFDVEKFQEDDLINVTMDQVLSVIGDDALEEIFERERDFAREEDDQYIIEMNSDDENIYSLQKSNSEKHFEKFASSCKCEPTCINLLPNAKRNITIIC